MARTRRLFMWGYQKRFQISAKVAAEAIFGKLEHGLTPKVFLVGILHEDREGSHPVCLEPENCGYGVDAFSNILDLAAQNEQMDSEHLIAHSHLNAQEQYLNRNKIRALREALKYLIDNHSVSNEMVTYISWPVNVGGYHVFVVLQFQKQILDKKYSLQNDRFEGRYRMPTSLIEETANKYLSECARALYMPEPGSGLGIIGDYDDILRSAGDSLMLTPVYAGGNISGTGDLFGASNIISNLRYEGSEGEGKLVIARRSHPNIKEIISFASPIRIRNHRAVRKLLQLTSAELVLLCDSYEIFGLGSITGNYKHTNEDLFVIRFLGHSSWDITHAGHSMMRVDYGQPRLQVLNIDFNRFSDLVARLFGEMMKEDVRSLWELVEEAGNQDHGALIVIYPDAIHEVERLASQSTRISPLNLTPDLIRTVTSIDGAVLIDKSGVCHAIGVILDGQVSRKGEPSRGSRFNSALRYVESVSTPCIAIVVSEDGSSDLLPDLKPRISKSTIVRKIAEFRTLLENESLDLVKYRKLLSWFSENVFYLVPEMCEEVNGIKHQLDELDVELMAVKIIVDDFLPNPEMNDSYFTD